MKARLALLAIPVLLAGCFTEGPGGGGAPEPAGQIDGAVVDQLLTPFANQTVTLVQLGLTDTTSPLGGFTFRGVPPGLYTLTTSLEGYRSDTQVVQVEAGKVSRVILQMSRLALPLPYFEAHGFTAFDKGATAGEVCSECEWAVPLGADRPAEVTLEATWDHGLLVGEENDLLDVLVTDGRGFTLYEGRDLASPLSLSIPGEDIHPEATELRVEVAYGHQFLPAAQEFRMDSLMTLFHGATKEQLFSVAR